MKRPPIAALKAVRVAIREHVATYPNPIRVAHGDEIHLDGREEEWDGWRWLWAAANGREGWVPDDLPVRDGRRLRAARSYSAAELSVRPGQRLAVTEFTHDWLWCIGDDGEEGWAPERCFGDDV